MADNISISENSKHKAERWTIRVLRLGVWISASLMIIGLVIAAVVPSSVIPLLVNPSLGDLVTRMFSGSFDPVTMMFVGIVLLMFTPILRVATAVIGFAVERDWRFMFVSIVVLLMLAGEIVYTIIIKG